MSSNVCLPLSKLEDVWKWTENKASMWPVTPLQFSTEHCYPANADFCHSPEGAWRTTSSLDKNKVPKTLLCHDMKGGYLGDRFIHGTQNPDEYRFFHWAGIDIFVYFSHHLITIPPPGWINAAHLHGVKVLGTCITEWDDGKEICNEILKSDENIQLFVDKLTSICVHYGFDGWLLNVENEVCKRENDVQKLASLVDKLKNDMHAAVPHSLVIWYDSVTIPDGKLLWQNELNVKNRDFFDRCDGIFLNYTWKEENLMSSKINACDRYHDVYVGVDVFGRNCFGGGGFNTNKALEIVRKHGLSVAIFAPGWVYQTLDVKNFTPLEYRFWNYLQPYLYLHGPCKLPFKTSFCQGVGLKKYHLGKEISSNSWYNLSLQQYQPSSGSCRHISGTSGEDKMKEDVGRHGCMETFIHDAFCGGSSLILSNPLDCDETKHSKGGEVFIQRILVCSFLCQSPLLISFVTKIVSEPSPELSILLKIKTSRRNCRIVELRGTTRIRACLKNATVILPITDSKMNELKGQYSLTDDMDWFHIKPTDGNWILRHYFLHYPQDTIVEIGAALNGTGSLLLGFLNLQELKPLR